MQTPQGTSRSGSSHMMLESGTPQSNQCIASLPPDTEADTSAILKLKHVEPIRLYPHILTPLLVTIEKFDSDGGMVMTHASPDQMVSELPFLSLNLFEKLFVYQFSYMSSCSWLRWPSCETQWFIGACETVVRTMRQVWIPNQAVRRPINLISLCMLLSSEKGKLRLVTKFTKKI